MHAPSSFRSPWHRAVALLPLAVLLLAACQREGAPPGGPGGPQGGGGMPPPQVGVVTVTRGAVPLATELPGRIEAARTAQVRARVTGIVLKRLFREGSDVKAGQPLFQIDPAPYQASLNSAQAQLARAQATAAQATALAERYKPLRDANAISQQEYVNAVAGQKQAEADVGVAKAALETARLNLGYATVTAPIAGRIGRALVTEGALVTQAEATQLALIQQLNPVYVNVTQPLSDLRRLREAVSSGSARQVDSVSVQLLGDDGRELRQRGRLLFSDISVDPTSSEVTLRAEVPNPDLTLLPGQYLRVRLAQAQLESAMLVPQQAVQRGPQGDVVMVVGADNKPAPRPVRLGGQQQGQWVVLSGLEPGDRVIADGFQKMRPGAPVTPVPWNGGAPAPRGPGGAWGAGGAASAPAAASGAQAQAPASAPAGR